MGGINLGAFMQGAVEGYDKGIKRSQDSARFQREQTQWAEEDRQLAAKKEFETQITGLRTSINSGSGDFANFLRPDAKAARESGVPTPGEETAKRSDNPLMNMGEGLYANQEAVDALYYNKLADITEKFYSIADPAKGALVREDLNAKRDAKFERRRKEAVALAMNGQREGLVAAQSAYKMYKDGRNVDTNSGTFDKATQTWVGINITDEAGKVLETRDFTPEHMMSILYMSDPAAMLSMQINQKKLGLEEAAGQRDAKKLPYEIGALQAKTFADREYGGALSGQKLATMEVAEQQKRAALFDPFFKQHEISPNAPPSEQDRLRISNAQTAAMRAAAEGLHSSKSAFDAAGRPVSAAAASTAVLSLMAMRLVNGVLPGVVPVQGAMANTHVGVKLPSGEIVAVPKGTVRSIINR